MEYIVSQYYFFFYRAAIKFLMTHIVVLERSNLDAITSSSGGQLEAVFLTEVNIAGAKSRTTSASMLRECWIQASEELDIETLHDGTEEYQKLFGNQLFCSEGNSNHKTILAAESSLPVSLRLGNQILRARAGDQTGIILITGSLHIVSTVLSSLHG